MLYKTSCLTVLMQFRHDDGKTRQQGHIGICFTPDGVCGKLSLASMERLKICLEGCCLSLV